MRKQPPDTSCRFSAPRTINRATGAPSQPPAPRTAQPDAANGHLCPQSDVKQRDRPANHRHGCQEWYLYDICLPSVKQWHRVRAVGSCAFPFRAQQESIAPRPPGTPTLKPQSPLPYCPRTLCCKLERLPRRLSHNRLTSPSSPRPPADLPSWPRARRESAQESPGQTAETESAPSLSPACRAGN